MKKLFFILILQFMAFMAHAQQPAIDNPHKALSSTKLGDVNGDRSLSISDVTLLVDYLMEQAGDSFILSNADVNKDGKITVSDVVSIIKIIVEGNTEPQAYLTCPDDHHPHMIDLGLPSGTKWACCNVGADKPEEYGGYYAWGETEEKPIYNDVTYQYATGVDYDGDGYYDEFHSDAGEYGTYGIWQNLGDDIVSTQHDVAHVKWGGSWGMPSLEKIQELLFNCTREWIKVNGIDGVKFTSKSNGGSIFLPAAGYRGSANLYDAGYYGYYWSSTRCPSYFSDAYNFFFNSDNAEWNNASNNGSGRTVRPVSK